MANRLVLDPSLPVANAQTLANPDYTPGGYGQGLGILPVAGKGIGYVPKNAAPAAPAPMAGGGGGSGGGAAAAATQDFARPSLDDYIKNNFLYTSTENQNQRQLDNFDAQTLRGQQDVQATQALKQHNLQQNLNDSGQANAEDLAGRGLLRSGINFQNQDRINQQGEQGQNQIAQLLTDFVGNRQQGRQSQLTSNQAALNAQIANLTQQFNGQNSASVV